MICPRCAKESLGVPLIKEENSRRCPLCQSIFQMKSHIDTFDTKKESN